MKLLQQLRRWRTSFLKQGETPAFIPLTAEEISVVASELPATQWNQTFMVSPPKIFGLAVFDSPFAEDMRKRQISVPVTQLAESVDVSWYKAWVEDDIPGSRLRYRLAARICSDTTSLKLKFEWDCWAAFKRKFRLTKWFPVKMRTAVIEGRVLYPYIKITLPFNRHRVTFTPVS